MLASRLNESNVNANGNRVRGSLVVYPNLHIKVNFNKDGRIYLAKPFLRV